MILVPIDMVVSTLSSGGDTNAAAGPPPQGKPRYRVLIGPNAGHIESNMRFPAGDYESWLDTPRPLDPG